MAGPAPGPDRLRRLPLSVLLPLRPQPPSHHPCAPPASGVAVDQWSHLRSYVHERGLRIRGDLPIFVAHDSSDVWAHPELFYLAADGSPAYVAGVPPDYFSATGQLWGNPLYRWDVLARSGYAWWIERFRSTLSRVDSVRLDHFRGFQAYWEVPGRGATARHR